MLILNIQFWAGDKDQAMALARLIADLEPAFRHDVIVMFTARFDCTHDESTIDYVSNKFQTIRYTTKRKATGWPNGPNQMMACSYEKIVEEWKKGRLEGAEAVMMVEADCVPLHKDWINMLAKEYRESGKRFLGAWLKKGDANCEHVNGNCIMSIDFWKKCRSIFHPPSRGGWDATLAYAILPNAHPSKLIWSDYQLGMPHNPWKGDNFLWEPKRYGCRDNALYGIDLHPVWFHGIKSMNGIKAVRKRLLNES